MFGWVSELVGRLGSVVHWEWGLTMLWARLVHRSQAFVLSEFYHVFLFCHCPKVVRWRWDYALHAVTSFQSPNIP